MTKRSQPAPKRTDANQAEIVKALRDIGASVTITSELGHGFPDLAVGFRGCTTLLEIKTENGLLTADEARWHAEWRGQAAIVRTVDEAIDAVINAR